MTIRLCTISGRVKISHVWANLISHHGKLVNISYYISVGKEHLNYGMITIYLLLEVFSKDDDNVDILSDVVINYEDNWIYQFDIISNDDNNIKQEEMPTNMQTINIQNDEDSNEESHMFQMKYYNQCLRILLTTNRAVGKE